MRAKEVNLFVATTTITAYTTTKKIFEKYNRAFVRRSYNKGNFLAVTYRVKDKDVRKIIKKLNEEWIIGSYTVTYEPEQNVVKFII